MAAPFLTVGAVFRRETRYLREWLAFHKLMGVDRFYLFCHGMPEDDPRDRDDARRVAVEFNAEFVPFNEIADFQMKANNGMLAMAKVDQAEWLAILDLDEFLFPVSPKHTLATWLRDRSDQQAAGFAVWWRCYGTSGLRYPPMLQTEAFTKRAKDDDPTNHTHKFILRPLKVETHDKRWSHGDILDENGAKVVKGKRFGTCHSIRINHYATRSKTDWALREKRGLPPGGFRLDPKDLPNFHDNRWKQFEKNDIDDPILHRYLPELKRSLGIEY